MKKTLNPLPTPPLFLPQPPTKTEFGADFSEDRQYRYSLWRKWGWQDERTSLPYVNFIMLNPSTADDIHNDPTVERCQRRAVAMGFGGLFVTNIFALRSTDPGKLKRVPDPIGPLNNKVILDVATNSACGMVVCAWGTHGKLMGRGETVISMLHYKGVKLHALALTEEKIPKHPLYLSYSLKPFPFTL